MRGKTPRWWVTRFELAAGLAAVLFAGGLVLPRLDEWSMVHGAPSIGVPMMLLPLVALALMVLGVVWMIRILRGPSDEPPPWRYRDR